MKAMTLKFTKKLVGAANFFQGAHSLSYEGGTLLIFLERQHLLWGARVQLGELTETNGQGYSDF